MGSRLRTGSGQIWRLENKLPRLYREMELHEKWWWNLQTHLMMKHFDEHPEDKEHPNKRQE